MKKPEVIDSATIFEAIREPFEKAYDTHVSKPGRETISLDPYTAVPLEDYAELFEDYQNHLWEWRSQGIDIEPIIKAVLLVDTATEANLPHYTAHIEAAFHPWHEWNLRWTAEERSHEEIMLRVIESREILDMSKEWLPVREQNMASGIHLDVTTPADGIAYVAVQELLTKLAHFHSASILDIKAAKNLQSVGGDEGRHYRFYMSMLRALGETFPDMALLAMQRQHEGDTFAMPGQKGIPGYAMHAKTIALGGLFDSTTILVAQKQTIEDAGLLKIDPVTDEGKRAQEWASQVAESTSAVWARKRRLMDILRERSARQIVDTEFRPFILGQTVMIHGNSFVAVQV
jgi:hypothetical protein